MIFNLSQSLVLAKAVARWLTMLALCGLQGCFSPMALDHAVIEYDKASYGHSVQTATVEYCPLPSASTHAFYRRFQYCRDL